MPAWRNRLGHPTLSLDTAYRVVLLLHLNRDLVRYTAGFTLCLYPANSFIALPITWLCTAFVPLCSAREPSARQHSWTDGVWRALFVPLSFLFVLSVNKNGRARGGVPMFSYNILPTSQLLVVSASWVIFVEGYTVLRDILCSSSWVMNIFLKILTLI